MKHHLGKRNWMIRILLASLGGTLMEIVVLLLGDAYSFWMTGLFLLEVPLMIHIVQGKERYKRVQMILSAYFFVVLINAVLEVLWNSLGENGGYLFLLIMACGMVLIGIRMWNNHRKLQKGIFEVEIICQEKRIRTSGLYDSGNQLKDGVSKKGVHIISKQLLERLEILDGKEQIFPVYVPYRALGNETGMLEVYYVEELRILGENKQRCMKHCPLGVTKDNLFEGKNYEIILNEEVF